MLNYPDWRAKKEAAYFKRFPDASPEDFIRTLPPYPPDFPPPEPDFAGDAGTEAGEITRITD
jgi:hypothetical protein